MTKKNLTEYQKRYLYRDPTEAPVNKDLGGCEKQSEIRHRREAIEDKINLNKELNYLECGS